MLMSEAHAVVGGCAKDEKISLPSCVKNTSRSDTLQLLVVVHFLSIFWARDTAGFERKLEKCENKEKQENWKTTIYYGERGKSHRSVLRPDLKPSLEKLKRQQNEGFATRPSVRNQQYPQAAENMKSHAETAEITKTCACTKNE